MAKNKGLSLNVPKDNIMYTNISKSKDGYNSARLVAKMGEKEYMSISYEWEGEGVPAFAMDLMGSMQAAEAKVGEVVASYKEEYDEYSKKKCKKKKASDLEDDDEETAAKKSKDGTKPVPADTTKSKSPKVCPNCGNAEEDCTCDGKKQLQKTKEKKGKEKKA